jgi:hypothetical protein
LKRFYSLCVVSLLSVLAQIICVNSTFSFPEQLRPIGGPTPLNFSGITSQATEMAVSSDNRFLVVAFGSSVRIIDLASFDLASSQIDNLAATVGGIAILPNGTSLYMITTDGIMHFTSVDSPVATPTEFNISSALGSSSTPGLMVAGRELGDTNLFFLDRAQHAVQVFDTSSNTITHTINLQKTTPTAIAVASFPSSFNPSRTTDRIFVTTETGILWAIEEDTFGATQINLAPNDFLSAVAIDPTNDRVYVVDQTTTLIHVLNTSDPAINIDAGPLAPITLDHIDNDSTKPFVNINLRFITATLVHNPSGTRLYVSGDNGVTIVNAVVRSDANQDSFNVIDEDGTAEPIPVHGPLDVNALPGPVIATSSSDGNVFTSNQGGSISLISDNPFVTINSADPAGPYNNANPSFSINFNTDENCAGAKVRIRANGDINESGSLLSETTLAGNEAQPLTSSTININTIPDPNALIEGENRIFVFVQDCDSTQGTGFQNNVGRNSVIINVDRPPPDVTILSTDFGNQKGIVNISRINQADINHYDVFVLQALNQANPSCPGGLDFSAVAPAVSAAQPSSGDSLSITIPNLTNGVFFCAAVQAVDNSGQKSPDRVVATDPILPEATVGIVGTFGEKGCEMTPFASSPVPVGNLAILVLGWMILLVIRFRQLAVPLRGAIRRGVGTCRVGRKSRFICFFLIFFLVTTSMFSFSPGQAHADEYSPKRFSAGFSGGFFMPKNHVLKEFLSDCCNGIYNFYFGPIFDSKYEVSLGVGFLIEDGQLVAVNTGRPSGEQFNFFVLPISNSFTFRGQFKDNQVVVPYATVGLDYMFFRENDQGSVTDGFKFGYHAAGGLMILMEWFDKMSDYLEREAGINDTFLTLEAKWMQIDNFGGHGLDFSGLAFSAGLLFEF